MSETSPGLKEERWQTVRLGDVAQARREPIDPNTKPELAYVGLEHIESGQIELTQWGIAKEVTSLKSKFFRNDILYGKLRPYLDKAVIAPIEGLCSTDIIVISPNQKILPEFLISVLHTHRFVEFANSTVTGVNHPRTSWNAIQEFTFALPPKSRQAEIARTLSAIRNSQKSSSGIISIASEMKKSVMAIRFRCAGSDSSSQKATQTEIGIIPERWKTASMGSLFEIQQGKALSPAARSGLLKPFLRTANIHWGSVDTTSIDKMNFTEEEESLYALRSGDLLICEGGDIGRTALWNGEIQPCYYQNHIHRLRPKNAEVIPAFYMYWMDAAMNLFGLYAAEANRTTIPNLSKGRLSSFIVPFPPKEDQQKIVEYLKAIDNKIVVEKERLAILNDLYQTLAHQLLRADTRLLMREVEINA